MTTAKLLTRRLKHYLFLFVLLLLVNGIAYEIKQLDAQTLVATVTTPAPTALVLGDQTKTANCVSAGGLPDSACTPGAADPAVTQENIATTICVSGYTKKVRPPTSYTNKIKLQTMAAYGDTGSPSDYELDHLIPLEIGGSPTDLANLWPEAETPKPGFHEKDVVENYLHAQVCSGKLDLKTAQAEAAQNWVDVYAQAVGDKP